jgi:hypothetical protein
MILFNDDYDIGMRYEGLARFAFDNCGKYDDPWGYCAQERYNSFVPTPSFTGKRALTTVIIKLIINNPDNEHTDKLKELEESVWQAETQESIIEIIPKKMK